MCEDRNISDGASKRQQSSCRLAKISDRICSGRSFAGDGHSHVMSRVEVRIPLLDIAETTIKKFRGKNNERKKKSPVDKIEKKYQTNKTDENQEPDGHT